MSERAQDEAVAEWPASMQRVAALVEGLDDGQLERRVPACPDWTGRDLLSHVVGLGADVLAGDEPDDHHESWTQAQVERRRDRSVSELLTEWRGLADDLVAWMREHGSRPLNDVVIHEQDLRGSLGRPGGADTRAFAIVRDRMAGRFASAVEGLPPVALVAPGWAWCSSGPVEEADVVLRASDFDLARALMSRRTASQLAGWVERGDVSAYYAAFAGLGDLPDSPLPE